MFVGRLTPVVSQWLAFLSLPCPPEKPLAFSRHSLFHLRGAGWTTSSSDTHEKYNDHLSNLYTFVSNKASGFPNKASKYIFLSSFLLCNVLMQLGFNFFSICRPLKTSQWRQTGKLSLLTKYFHDSISQTLRGGIHRLHKLKTTIVPKPYLDCNQPVNVSCSSNCTI